MASFSVAIMAGGKSSRMGTDKSFVELHGKPMIEHLIEQISNLNQAETLLITNRPNDYSHLGLPMVSDVFPDSGSLGGIYTAIYNCKNPDILVIACDMPFVKSNFLQYMLDCRTEENGPYDVIVPRVNDYPEGLHAIYSKQCLAPIKKSIAMDRLKVIGFYDEVRVRYLDEAEYHPFDPNGLSFFNVNTPEQLAEAERLTQQN
jgi:molybdopterin-guanine dinucleotide biosynthesis protein A